MTPKALTLDTICDGALPERFERAIQQVLDNMRDLNTDPEQRRSIVVKFEFTPLPDRSGAVVTVKVENKLAATEAIRGSVYIARNERNEPQFFTHDPKQQPLVFAGDDLPKQ